MGKRFSQSEVDEFRWDCFEELTESSNNRHSSQVERERTLEKLLQDEMETFVLDQRFKKGISGNEGRKGLELTGRVKMNSVVTKLCIFWKLRNASEDKQFKLFQPRIHWKKFTESKLKRD